jgi:Rrf2 family transcriptional regulator, nitric oxide-sensitive transcriptional repressor
MMTQTVEYALRAVTTLAYHEGEPATTEGVAEMTKVPVAYLAKILQGLAKAGIIRTQRGVGGGVALAKPASELTILDVVNAVEPIRRYKTCPLGIQSHGSRLCPLHARLDKSLADLEAAFGGVTLADIIAEPTLSKPLCEVPDTPGTTRVPLGTVKPKKAAPAT